MLVLTRKKAEEIRIGDNIVIKILQAGPNKVKIGIEAPKDVRVLRGEKTEFETEGVVGMVRQSSNVTPVNMVPGNVKLKVLRELKKAEKEAESTLNEEQVVSELEWYLAAYA
jgi:carbon storage regulator